jgi:hypothetical protein
MCPLVHILLVHSVAFRQPKSRPPRWWHSRHLKVGPKMWHSGNLVVVVLAGRLLKGGVHSRKPRSRLPAFYSPERRVDVDLDWSGCSRALSMIAICCPNSLVHSHWLTPDVPGPVRLPEYFATFLLVDACDARHSQTARILRCIPIGQCLACPIITAFLLVDDARFA